MFFFVIFLKAIILGEQFSRKNRVCITSIDPTLSFPYKDIMFSITTIHTLFRFPYLLPIVLALFQVPIRAAILHYSSCPLRLLLAVTVSQAFLVSDDHNGFKERGADIL